MFDTRNSALPKFVLTRRILKHKPKHVTHVVIPVVPRSVSEFSAVVRGKLSDDRLVNVPDKSIYVREHQARLEAAEVE